MPKTIVVVGGTGMLGQPVARSLKDAGFQVRVMTRDHQKASKLFDDSFEIFAGDPMEANCMEEALHGCHGVHISLPPEVEQPVSETVAQVAAEDYARMVATAYGLGAGANQRFIVHGPEAIRMQDALRRYCAVFQPDIKQVSTMPVWLVKLLATLTNNSELKSAGELMAYFDKVGEGSYAATVDGVLGAPTTTLDIWLETRHGQTQTRAHAGQEAVH